MNEEDLKLLAMAQYMIKLEPKFMSAKKLQALIYYAQVQHLTTYGDMMVKYNYYACNQGPYMPRLDKVLTPGFFIKRNPRLSY